MLHFFDKFIDDKNEGAGIFGILSGCVIMVFIFQYANKLIILLGVWGPIIATIAGMVGTVITGMLMIIGKDLATDLYKEKIKPKLFKTKKDDKETDNQKAA